MTEYLGSRLASSNDIKRKQYMPSPSDTPQRALIDKTRLFDEDNLKIDLEREKSSGPYYFGLMAQAKLKEQRDLLLTQEGRDTDYAIIVADSGGVVEIYPGNHMVINRDDPRTDDENQAIAQKLKDDKQVTYIGSIAFGRKDGKANYVVNTYYDTPLREDAELTRFPHTKELPGITDTSKPYRFGYIRYGLAPDGSLTWKKQEVGTSYDFESSRQYISGLTPKLVEVAEEVSLFERSVSGVLESIVEGHPFNDLIFYSLFEKSGLPLEQFYKRLVDNDEAFFQENGGNCNLFALETMRKLVEGNLISNPRILMLPSTRVRNGERYILHPNAHCTTIADNPRGKTGMSYVIDTGLTNPHPIPYSPGIPFMPTEYADAKAAFVDIADYNNDNIPDLILISNKARLLFPGQGIITPEEYRQKLPDMLINLHINKDIAKIDFHTPTGEKKLGISCNIHDKTISCSQLQVDKIPLSEFIQDETKQTQLQNMCVNSGIDYTYLYTELSNLL